MISWLQSHTEGVLIAISLTAFIESFALIGIFVPGVVMLFSLAAVASNLNIPVVWVMLAAAIGASFGDIGSYYLGYRLRHRLHELAWYKRHAVWLSHGIWFFHRWGWLSVVVGRFMGPIRPVVPLIAGSLSMPARIFIPVSLISVLAWAPAYILPGYLAGEASLLITTENLAIRTLSLLMLSGLAVLIALLAIYHHLHPEHPRMARWLPLYSKLPDTFPYAPLLLALASFCGFILITASRPWALDTLLMQQVSTWRETAADPVFRGITLIGDPAILGLTGLIVTFWLFISGQSRLSGLLLGFSLLMLWVIPELKSLFAVARPDLVIQLPAGHAYPSGHAAGFAVYLGLLTVMANERRPVMNRWNLYLPAGIAMLTIGLSRVWLGVHWLSDVLAGLLVALLAAAIATICHRLWGNARASFQGSITLWPLILLCFAAYLILVWPQASLDYALKPT